MIIHRRELRIIKNTLSEVVIQKDREYIAFRVNENGLYVNGESQITVTDDGMCTRYIVTLNCAGNSLQWATVMLHGIRVSNSHCQDQRQGRGWLGVR